MTSVRFSDWISYRSDADAAFDAYVVPLTGRSTPYDTYTVTAHGGRRRQAPTTAAP